MSVRDVGKTVPARSRRTTTRSSEATTEDEFASQPTRKDARSADRAAEPAAERQRGEYSMPSIRGSVVDVVSTTENRARTGNTPATVYVVSANKREVVLRIHGHSLTLTRQQAAALADQLARTLG